MTMVLPINADVMKWARETHGLSHKDVAEKLGRKSITADTVREWEAGNGSPNFSQLEVLARQIYNRPLAVFFFPIVPDEETMKSQLRTLPDTVVDYLPNRIIKLHKKARLFQLFLEELYESKIPSEISLLSKFTLEANCEPSDIASKVRKTLGISFEEQSKWRSTETGFKNWREALESHGIFVFKDAFRNNEYSGFCLYDTKYPIIYVNNSMPASRQEFTLFHELAHLLHHSGGVDFHNSEIVRTFSGYYHDLEVCCNRFASELLVPQEEFNALRLEVSETRFEELAEYFSVSREVILRKYLDRNLIDTDYYVEMSKKWMKQVKSKQDKSSGGNTYYNLRAYLGERYIDLVYTQYYRNKISEESVAEYLTITPKRLSSFERWVLEGGKH